MPMGTLKLTKVKADVHLLANAYQSSLLIMHREVSEMPVTMANVGQTVIINRITGTDDVRQHLAELGFVVGERITVVSNIGGNVILQVKDARIALDRKMAARVMVA